MVPCSAIISDPLEVDHHGASVAQEMVFYWMFSSRMQSDLMWLSTERSTYDSFFEIVLLYRTISRAIDISTAQAHH